MGFAICRQARRLTNVIQVVSYWPVAQMRMETVCEGTVREVAGLAAVGHEHGVALDPSFQSGIERATLEVVENVITGGLVTVARDQNYVVVVG